jgi:hypothetical protein
VRDVKENESYGFLGEKAHAHLMKYIRSDKRKYCFARVYADGSSGQCFYIAILQALQEKLDVTLEEVQTFKQECYQNIREQIVIEDPLVLEEVKQALDPSQNNRVDSSVIMFISEVLDVNIIAIRSNKIYPYLSLLSELQQMVEEEDSLESERPRRPSRPTRFEIAQQAYSRVRLFRPTILLYHRTYLDLSTKTQNGHFELLGLFDKEDCSMEEAMFQYQHEHPQDQHVDVLSLVGVCDRMTLLVVVPSHHLFF